MATTRDVADKLADQEASIAHQRRLLAALEREGNGEGAKEARSRLERMERELETMRGGEDPDPLDEQSMDAVARDCPL